MKVTTGRSYLSSEPPCAYLLKERIHKGIQANLSLIYWCKKRKQNKTFYLHKSGSASQVDVQRTIGWRKELRHLKINPVFKVFQLTTWPELRQTVAEQWLRAGAGTRSCKGNLGCEQPQPSAETAGSWWNLTWHEMGMQGQHRGHNFVTVSVWMRSKHALGLCEGMILDVTEL